MLIEWLLIPFAYLLGSVSSAVIVSRALGLPDPRQEGSKNPGATNVLRLGGKQAAILTLLGDASKGLIPLLIAKSMAVSPPLIAAVGFAAFVGHLYPVFFQFKGGKGVATALGVLLGFAWPVGVMALLTWLGVAALFRFSSLSALAAAVLAPVYVWFWLGSAELVVATMFMSTLLVYRHKGNIERLLKAEETRLGAKRR
ncbi:glycerol-3-phosphate 1-O-acyltransferase PlsY [Methylococcus mesophilus]|uniref:glycerol-3-phosphate 1-O-acyltransferase PlsY n=1 Tax=Methylococcus mesophilus TaxID=2993564 RepID=UPI00224A8216|nr:glycerol-3-phosphate 1-O-acyltransferase PlsY [Methylococcus mesophilus]UZR27734.1 glycerol-3-phosphate 1-O-acyltransferase PlsY [Methylococcus mesophilus]